jgi:tetratricopeptide (TPR) repeat protein
MCSAPAMAQSKKYPPVAPDKDAQAEKHSALWDGAAHPDKGPYDILVRDAKRLTESGDAKGALEKLDLAIAKLPKEPEAHQARGYLFMQQKQWAKCAEDLRLAEETQPKTTDVNARTRLRIDLGVCQARAGFYAAAETTFVHASSNGPAYKGEMLMRLGETRIAMGKLDEAIDALAAALEQTDSTKEMTRWLITLAYDRARKPSEAQQYALDAKRYDQSLSLISSPRMPMLGQGDTEYMYGVAYLYAMPRPEYALLYFRRYLSVAGDSPWKKRAEEHIKEISSMALPARDSVTMSGSSATDINVIRDALGKSMGPLRQCVAKMPSSAFQLTITRVGPRTSDTARDRPIYRVPPPEVRASNVLNLDGRGAEPDVTAANRCLESIANRIALPQPKDRDTFYRVSFIIVSPDTTPVTPTAKR